MKKINGGLQKLNFINNNHSIVYAPNSTGKTRLTKKLAKEYKEEQAMFFTSTTINNMLSFSGRKIYVGSDSSFKVENDNIVKEYNKNRFGNELLKMYDSKNALLLTKNSCLFNYIELTRKDTFEIYSRLKDFQKDNRLDNQMFDLFEMIDIDKMLSKLDLDSIKRIASDNIQLIIEKNEYTISKELKDKLQSIFESIDSSKQFCPLCGCKYDSNRKLKIAIKEMLEKYNVSSDVHDYELCVNFINTLESVNNHLGLKYFYTNYSREISVNLLLDNIKIIEEFLLRYSEVIIKTIDKDIDRERYEQYKRNKIIIDKEDNLRRNSVDFCANVVKVLNELITLPDGYIFKAKNEKVEVVDSLGKSIDPIEFLSESEQRRMCISIVFAEIKQRDLRYIVFDDPVDSNDDYYFDISINVIGDLLLSNQTLNWIVLTHEFRVISILSERCRLSDNVFSKSVDFLFYLPDPSFNGSNVPPFSLISTKADSLSFLNEHETIIFKKIFMGESGYQCDKELALLSSFNPARNLYNDIINNHRIAKHKLKSLCHVIATGNKSYEHYKNGRKRIMRLSTLFVMNKLMYESISSSYYTNSKAYASNFRNKFISTVSYSSIYCGNSVLKYILFAMIRVMNSHYLFEKKLARWASLNLPSFVYSNYESKLMILNKLKYVESICSSSKITEFNKYKICFSKWRGLLNDFAHSASRMVPPYLTISPIEMYKLEISISNLP